MFVHSIRFSLHPSKCHPGQRKITWRMGCLDGCAYRLDLGRDSILFELSKENPNQEKNVQNLEEIKEQVLSQLSKENQNKTGNISLLENYRE